MENALYSPRRWASSFWLSCLNLRYHPYGGMWMAMVFLTCAFPMQPSSTLKALVELLLVNPAFSIRLPCDRWLSGGWEKLGSPVCCSDFSSGFSLNECRVFVICWVKILLPCGPQEHGVNGFLCLIKGCWGMLPLSALLLCPWPWAQPVCQQPRSKYYLCPSSLSSKGFMPTLQCHHIC